MSFAKYLLSGLAIFLAACGAPREAEEAKQMPPIQVKTALAEVSQWTSDRVIPGTVTARSTTAVSARLAGHVREIRVREGDAVAAGQVIAVIDSRDAESAIRQAEAAREEARAALPEAEAATASARAQAELAQATFRRMEELHTSRSITGQEFDEAKAKLRLAEAQTGMAQARQQQVRERIRQAAEAVGRARLQEGYATVTAPFAGVVVERKAEPGTFASPGMPVIVLEKAGEFRLETAVEESLAAGLRPGRMVTVEMDSAVELPIAEILPSVNAQSRTATVRVNLPNRPGLRTGMSARLRISGEPRTAVTVPRAAVRADGQLRMVFVVENQRARAVLIPAGEERDGRVEAPVGLEGNERVVVSPPAALRDGSSVLVTQ